MDISNVLGPAASQASKYKTGDEVSLAVLKKAMDVEASAAAQMIDSVATPAPEIPAEKLPPHIGRNLNVTA